MAARLAVEIIGDASSLEKALKKSSRGAKNFQKDISKTGARGKSAFGGLTKGLGLVTGALGVAGVAGAAKAAFTEMAEGQKVAAQTNAVLKSTGGAANVSAKQIDALATSILKKSGIDDEAIKSGENLLLTFTNVRNEVGKGNDIFSQATGVMADMSTALGQDMKSSAIQLGKALNDPVKGVTALQRVGVSFTAAQKEQIKAMVKAGDTMGAQKLILHELNKEFGGSAEAAGKTLPGKLNILKETMLNLGGSIAETLTPAITRVVDRMVAWLSNTKNQQAVMDAFKTAVGAVTAALKILKGAFDVLAKVVGGNRNAILALVAAYATFKAVTIAGSVAKLAASFGLLGRNTKGATTASRGLSASFLGKAGLVVGAGAAAFEITTLALKLTGLDKKLKGVGASAFDAAAKIGLVNDPGKQFEGKRLLSPGDINSLRKQAQRLHAGGLGDQEIATELARRHQRIAKRDIEVAIGLRDTKPGLAKPGGMTFNNATIHVHGVQNVKQLEQELHKRARTRPKTRRDP